jgi:phosphoglycolate phosphatase/AHBA synthesis associated protein
VTGAPRNQEVKLAVLFDLDGVLVDTFEMWFHMANAAARHWGYPAVSRERFEACWGQGVEEDVETFFPRQTLDEVERYYNANVSAHLDRLVVMEAAPETVRALREAGHKTCVITNTPAPMAGRLLERAGIATDALVGGADVARPKPAPDMVHRACELLGVDSARAVVVGDSRYDREAARAAGVRFVGYRTDGDERIERLDRLADLLP